MGRFIALSAAFVLSCLVLGMLGRAGLAEDRVLGACEAGGGEIEASDLPGVVEPGECPVGGREISDGAVSVVVPPPGRAVYAEVLTTGGAQELEVRRRQNGAIELDHVGKEPSGGQGSGEEPADVRGMALERAVNREGCDNPGYEDLDHKVTETTTYAFRVSTTPRGLGRAAARNAIRRAALNVFDTRNPCRMGDRVPVALRYGGATGTPAQVGDGMCGLDDGRSVVAFGALEAGYLAAACTLSEGRPFYDEVTSADVKINRADFRWTTAPGRDSCRKAYDVETVMTHEWGHVYGLGHVPENGHRNLTMSPIINGPCQSSERSLGRGDVLGLENKYR